ncbi:extracellular solute-binding protein [Clostridium sp. MCC353]|uniref:ABC transporter substrate-binding protein n=1 Tax=Clostridium sp. MCC353 TaxID=2592646 RepID=UPI001C010060|nr:ABC transporter substrate-binding protein [Clostridium sp. MCC353]MBT9775193.1 extracellular solute-binding protein [Clostridium sp. MCC353]
MRKNAVKGMLCAAMAAAVLSGCASGNKKDDSVGKVYYLNFKPEVTDVWEELAKVYTQETGVEVKVVTAAGGNYESTLKSEIAKTDAPTLFQINGPIGYQSWKDYCLDLKDSDFYKALIDKSVAITGEDGGVYGIPFAIEGYGIIYNNAIMEKYFAMDGAVVTSADEINNFDTLKAVVEDMQSKKEGLGIKGVFASTSLLPGEEWRWQTHTANLPIYQEYQDKDVDDLDEIEFTYSDNFKNIFDLYINNSTTDPKMLGSKGVNDSMAEFALGQAAMVQNGNWAWGQIADVSGNVVKAEDIGVLPVYMGLPGEENQGLCAGTENYFCINKQVSEASQKASLDFVYWLVNSETGKDYMTNKLGNIAPFSTFGDEEKPTDPLAQLLLASMDSGKTNIPWVFTTFPSQTFKDNFGSALLEYAQGTMSWDEVKAVVVEQWKVEKAAGK